MEADDRGPAGLPEWEAEGQPLAPRDDEDNEASADLIEQVLGVCEWHYTAVTGTNSGQWDRESARDLVDVALRTVHLAERPTRRRWTRICTSTGRG